MVKITTRKAENPEVIPKIRNLKVCNFDGKTLKVDPVVVFYCTSLIIRDRRTVPLSPVVHFGSRRTVPLSLLLVGINPTATIPPAHQAPAQ